MSVTAPRLRDGLRGDVLMFARTYHPHRSVLYGACAFAAQPGASALLWIRLATSRRKVVSLLARRRLIRFGCDVERGAIIAPGLLLAHPLGVFIGGSVVIEPGVKLHHHVSLGPHRGGSPIIGSGAYVYAGAVVVGAVTVGRGAAVGANAFVAKDVPPGGIVPGGVRWT